MNVSKGDAVTYVALVTCAVLQAAEPLRKEAATPPDLHPVLSSSAWAYIPLALLALVACIWLYRQIAPAKERPNPATAENRAQAQQPIKERGGSEIAPAEGAPDPRSYLKETRLNAGMPDSSPEMFPNVAVCFGRSGRDAHVCVDFSHLAGNLWIQRQRLLLKNIPSFRRDERVSITILYRDIDQNGLMWRWGDGQIKYSSKAAGTLQTNLQYQCRLAFIFADGTEEYAYFIVETDVSAATMPRVIGEHLFAFVRQWESE
jgi:hypothetical protein